MAARSRGWKTQNAEMIKTYGTGTPDALYRAEEVTGNASLRMALSDRCAGRRVPWIRWCCGRRSWNREDPVLRFPRDLSYQSAGRPPRGAVTENVLALTDGRKLCCLRPFSFSIGFPLPLSFLDTAGCCCR